MNIDWEYLREFKVVAESESFGNAAKKLGMDTSNFARRLRSLEDQIGTNLFSRRSDGYRSTTLTPKGEKLYQIVKKNAAEIESVFGFIPKSTEPIKTIKIKTTPGLAKSLLPEAIRKAVNKYSFLTFKVETTYHFDSVEEDEILIAGDISIRGGVSKQTLCSTQSNLYASKDYSEHHGLPTSAAECCTHRFLVLDKEGKGQTEQPDYITPIIQPFLRSNSMEFLIESCRKGLGILELADIHPATKTLKEVPIDDVLPISNISVYFTNQINGNEYIKKFIYILQKEISSMIVNQKLEGSRAAYAGSEDSWYEPH
jgi:DNA-binding transcriptional LysR family regulator